MKTMLDLFHHIRYLAQHPLDEIYTRHIWRFLSQHPEYDVEQIFTIKEYVEKSCGIAAMGMSAVLAGTTSNWLKINDKNQFMSNYYKICTKESFYLYDFEIEYKDYSSGEEKDGHKFIVIQYKGTDNQVCYTFLQAYADIYSLENFLTKAAEGSIKQHYTQEEFMQFMAELNAYIASDECNSSFIQQYFHATDTNFPGKIRKKLFISATPSNLFQVELAEDTFQRYKKSAHYPEFTFISNVDTEGLEIFKNPSDEGGDEVKKCLIDTPACFEQRMIAIPYSSISCSR